MKIRSISQSYDPYERWFDSRYVMRHFESLKCCARFTQRPFYPASVFSVTTPVTERTKMSTVTTWPRLASAANYADLRADAISFAIMQRIQLLSLIADGSFTVLLTAKSTRTENSRSFYSGRHSAFDRYLYWVEKMPLGIDAELHWVPYQLQFLRRVDSRKRERERRMADTRYDYKNSPFDVMLNYVSRDYA